MKEGVSFDNFIAKFGSKDFCLAQIKKLRYPRGINCPKCRKKRKFHPVKNRRCYSCDVCLDQVYPCKGTIFENSRTPLTKWFLAMYLMSQTRSGLPAMELQRILGVTYKTAWRMGHKIRELMKTEPGKELKGIVEIDETYVGGNPWENFRKTDWDETVKEAVMGLVERGGDAVVVHLKYGVGKYSLIEPIEKYVRKDAHIMTDQLSAYQQLRKFGYKHDSVLHKREFRRGDVYTQNVENVWSHFKRGIVGVYRSVSKKHLQKYADEFAFRYNNRFNPKEMFDTLFLRINFKKKGDF